MPIFGRLPVNGFGIRKRPRTQSISAVSIFDADKFRLAWPPMAHGRMKADACDLLRHASSVPLPGYSVFSPTGSHFLAAIGCRCVLNGIQVP